jgi:quinol monooxygenase YgiN
MATALVHITVRPGREADFERVAADLHGATHDAETAVRRYEYWRGAEPSTYYALMSFDDYTGFLVHQSSPHHEAARPELGEVVETLRFEWVDPVPSASSLPPTEVVEPAGDESALVLHYHERFGVGAVQEWWRALR